MATKQFIVIGLGTFGAATAAKLHENGARVTGVDASRERVERLKDCLYEPIIADATQREALAQLSLEDASAVIISLGEDIELSLLAALHVKELGARRIIVKGVTPEHGRLLERIGVDQVIFPEVETAQHLADREVWTNVIDFLPIDPEYNFEEIAVPDSFTGKSLKELDVRRRYAVWIIGIKDALTGKLTMFPDGEYKIGLDQLMLVVGKKADLAGLRNVR